MPDLDIRRTIQENGFSFRKIFTSILTVAISVFLAFQWQGFLNEVINTYFPKGSNLLQKFILNIAMTILLVCVTYMLMRWERRKEERDKRFGRR